MNNENLDNYEDDYDDDLANDIAIIGMAGRFPKAKDIDEFWTNLVSSQNCITEFSSDELRAMGVDEDTLNHPNYVPMSGFVEDQDKFDAHFFEFNPREAEQLDPQHRIALEVAWQCMEDAGYVPDKSTNSVGVFAGVNMSTYLMFNLMQQGDNSGVRDAVDLQVSVDKDMIATRLSYKFNLQGPSVSLGTACSTSLVAIHLACQSLLNGESKMALAGGAHIATPNTTGHVYREGGYSSPDGVCRAFDEKGKGTVAGNGCCFVLLKPLEDALADNDHIYAVVKGSAINNDGSEKIGYTAPSIEGQTNIVAEAQAVSGVHPDSIRFIEAHGTGTPLGDPIEFTALTRAFRIETERKQYCAIGSLKTNMGHLGTAAGAASVIKSALALKHKVIPESLNYEKPNPKLDIENSPFYVASELERIEASDEPARAGISALGIGGTNAHVILEEPPEVESSESRDYQVLLLSAKTPSALDNMTENLADFISNKVAHYKSYDGQSNDLADVAYTLQVGRAEYDFKRAFVVPEDIGHAGEIAKLISPETGLTAKASDSDQPIVFMFSGGGTQYVNMAKDLYESEPYFKAQMAICADLFKRKGNLDILDLLFISDDNQFEVQTQVIARPKIFFAALFAVEYSMSQLWMNWGIKPDAVVGHSLGEYVAATVAGVFSLEDAVGLISYRGDLFDTKVIKGGMISVSLSEAEVQSLLIEGVSIATINDKDRCVVAGTNEAMDAFEKLLLTKEIDYRRLSLGAAGHSALVEPAMPDFGRYIDSLTLNTPEIPLVSNVTGAWADQQEICSSSYWVRHLRETVRFSDCIDTLIEKGSSVFIEVGPGNSLISFVRAQTEPKDGHVLVNSLRHIKEEKNDLQHLLEGLGKLWINGVSINWDNYYSDETRKRLPVPTYPYNSKRYWVEPKKSKSSDTEKLPVDEWFNEPSWRFTPKALAFNYENSLDLKDQNYLVFVDEFGVSKSTILSLVETLRDKAPKVVFVEKNVEKGVDNNGEKGTEFARIDEITYQLNPLDESNYQTLFDCLSQSQLLPTKVIYGWNLDNANLSVSESETLPTHYYLSPLYLSRSLDKALDADQSVDVTIITNYLESVLPSDTVNPDKALITGPLKVIPYECARIKLKVIDTDIDVAVAVSDPRSNSTSGISAEILEPYVADETTIAVRNNMRFVKEYHPIDLNKLDTAPSGQTNISLVKEKGVYLITGGLGGVGMVHAIALAALNVKPRLVLMQRSEFPSESEWSGLLESADTDLVLKQQIESLLSLKATGAELQIVTGDVCDKASLARVVDTVQQHWGDINGVIHCAGYGEFVSVAETNATVLEDVLSPKVLGTKNIEAVLANNTLDFVLLCSSLSSVTTGFGLLGYVSACAYLDSVVQANKDSDTFYAGINWDIWKTPQHIAKTKMDVAAQSQDVKTAILEQEGVDVIQRVLGDQLASGAPLSNKQIIVSTRDLNQLQKQSAKLSTLLQSGIDDDLSTENEELTLYDRPALSTPYEAAENDKEALLVEIWQEILGISQIGVLDNFFELGGESLLGVKIVVKAKQHGLNIDPKQMFSKPTIRETIEMLADAPLIEAEQGVVTGEAACSAVQSEFLSRGLQNPQHWNVGTLFTVNKPLSQSTVQAIANRLLNHHDVLRSQFKLSDSGQWLQVLTDKAENAYDYRDISTLSTTNFSETVIAESEVLQTEFNLETGRVFKLVYFKGPDNQGRLLLLAHHLVMDAMSLGFVIEDLSQLLSLSDDEILTAGLLLKTTSFLEYSEKLKVLSQEGLINQDLPYWQSQLESIADGEQNPNGLIKALPRDFPEGKNRESSAEKLDFKLTDSETEALLNSGGKLNELLVAAIGAIVCGWSGSSNALIDVYGHGRNTLSDDVDVSRTVGWFGGAVPIPLTYSLSPLQDQISNIINQINLVPNDGLSFNCLKYLSDDHVTRTTMGHLPTAEISLNYLGDISAMVNSGVNSGRDNEPDSILQPAQEALITMRAEDNTRRYEHDVVAFIENGCLSVSWEYSQSQCSKATIEQLLNALSATLKTLGSTPLDLDTDQQVEYSAPDLSHFNLSEYDIAGEAVELIYGVTPFQKELYQLSKNTQGPITNIVQGVSMVEGPLNGQLLKGIWQTLIARHPILRTCFIESANSIESANGLAQVVLKTAELDLREQDWSDKTKAEQDELTQQLLERDRLTPFDLSKAPALRMWLIKLNTEGTQSIILQSNHQIILDGWSSSLLAQDLAYCVSQLAAGAQPAAVDTSSYFGGYISWLDQREEKESQATQSYWQEKMRDFVGKDLLSELRKSNPVTSRAVDHYGEHNQPVTTDLISNLKEAARVSRTTLNALFQGAWALSLKQVSGADEITYGVTVSGRSSEWEGVTHVIGQCTNSLPIRLNTTVESLLDITVAQWLQEIHQQNLDIQHHNLISPSEVKAIAGLDSSSSIYQSNVIFENIPMPADDGGEADQPSQVALKVTEGYWTDGWQFPLRLFVVPEGEDFWVRLAYDSGEIDSAQVAPLAQRLMDNLQKLAESIDLNTDSTIASLLKS